MKKKNNFLTPTEESIISLYTNEIDDNNFIVNHELLDAKFDFWVIDIKETEENNYGGKIIEISSDFKKQNGVVASVHDKKYNCKVFMIKKNTDISSLVKKYSMDKIKSFDILDWNLHHLICNGVCGLKNISKLDNFSYETRYYQIVDYNKWNDVIEIITVQVQIKSDWNIATSDRTGNKLPLVLASSTTTFTNIEAIEKSNSISKKRKAKLLASEKYELNGSFMAPLKGKAKTSSISSGIFIRGSIKKTKNRTPAFQVNHKKLDKTDGMRADVLFKYYNALNSVYGDAVKLKFKSYDFDINYSMQTLHKAKENEYTKITDLLQNCTIRIINKSATAISENIKELIHKTLSKNNVIYGGEICQTDLVLIFVDTEEEYKKSGSHDLYKEFKSKYPLVVSQAVVMSEITKATTQAKNSIIEFNCIQLFIKLEVAQGKFLIARPELSKYVFFIEPIRIKDGNPILVDIEDELIDEDDEEDTNNKADDFVYYKGIFVNGKFTIFKLKNEEIEQIKEVMSTDADLVFGRKKSNGKLTKNRNSMVYYPKNKKYMIFTETSRSILPNQELINKEKTELEQGRKEKVGRKFFEDYSININYECKPRKAIESMLNEYPDANAFGYDVVIKQALKGLRGKNRDELPDLIYKELGIRWLDKAQRISGKDLVNHQYGFNFSYKNKVYFGGNIIGSHDNKVQQNFCTLYQIITNMTKLPEGMHEWFLSFSIRNKQTTIKPYFFKHIREYAQMEYWRNKDQILTPNVVEIEAEVAKKDPLDQFDTIS